MSSLPSLADLQVYACRGPPEEFCGDRGRQIDWRNLLEKKTLRDESEGFKLGAGAGFEPAQSFLQVFVSVINCQNGPGNTAQLSAQSAADLQTVLLAWPKLSAEMRAAIVAVTRAAFTSEKSF
jgi:hypothetical protein